jgi:hypothetical protein
MPAEGVRRFDDEAFVAEVSYGDVIVRRELVEFLAAVHPFAPTVAPAAPDMQQVRLSDVALVHPGDRPTW